MWTAQITTGQRAPWWAVGPVVLAAAALISCSIGPAKPSPDVLLITIDTLRADYVGAYGAGSQATPFLDELAARSVLFERAIAAASRTVPAHASIMTSKPTRGHSVGHRNGETVLTETETLAEQFRQAGYQTAAFVSNILLTRGTGLNQGFEIFDDELVTPELNRPHVVERLARDTTHAATQWLTHSDTEKPRFLWVHYQDPHGPYTPPEEDLTSVASSEPATDRPLPIGGSNQARGVIPPYQVLPEMTRPSEYRDRYAGEIHYADRQIRKLIAQAERSAGDRPLIILVTADHGESLGEARFHFMHTHTTTPEVAHIPMIFSAPGFAPQRMDETVGHVDIMPTLIEAAGLTPPEDAVGIALGPILRNETTLPDRWVYCDIGTQFSAYHDDGFLRAGGLQGAWRKTNQPAPEIRRARGQRYRWQPGGMWRADGLANEPLPPAMVDYAERAVPMVPLQHTPPELEDRLRALGYLDD